jgi:hypothetical protein
VAHRKIRGFVGIDYEQYGDVDIVHNIEITPWPLPDECVLTAVASHVMEHITPHTGDSRLQPLIDLLVEKDVITQSEAIAHMGQPGPAFLASNGRDMAHYESRRPIRLCSALC